MKFPIDRLSYRHLLYSLIIVFLAFAPGFTSLFQSYLGIKETSKNLNALDIAALLETDFGMQVFQYVVVALLLTLLFTFLCSYSSIKLSKLAEDKVNPNVILYAFPATAILGLLVIHAWLFPYSRHTFSSLYELDGTHPASLLGIASLISIAYFIILMSVKLFFRFKKITGIAAISSLIITIFISTTPGIRTQNPQPNVFFIGIDSLRLDMMQESMPFLMSKIEQAKTIENAYTPFARTFPSWSTILSGQFPPTSGARYNLIDESLLNKSTTYLPSILKRHGYQTAYASDERRFSQIGNYHGFDHVLGPRTGLGDFVLGNYADHPLTNFLTKLPNSDVFLPEITVNRAASRTYHPGNFSDYLDGEIETLADNNKPLFLATHFCLAHWPFRHGSSEYEVKGEGINPHYLNSLNDVDNQIKRLWTKLESEGLIENSIFVLLSDHGESWSELYTYKDNTNKEFMFKTHGHGINVVSDNEHKVLMSFLGHKKFDQINASSMSTLADLTPTILSTLSIPFKAGSLDGYNLLNKDTPRSRIFPVESGFTVTATTGSDIDPEEAAQQAMARYKINENGEMRIKVSEIPFLNSGKRIGVRDERYLLTYQAPIFDTEKRLLLLDTVKLKAKEITDLSSINSATEKALTTAMCKWYSTEISTQALCTNQHAFQ